MAEPILVCPFNEKLISGLRNRNIVIHTDDFNQIHHIRKLVNKSNQLFAVKLQTGQTFSSIDFRDDWAGIPLALYCPDFGNYKDFSRRLPVIRKLNIRIFLSAQYEFNFTALKILSSLKICSGLYITGEPFSWDLMNDLMHYAIYGKAGHAPVEPFSWLASHYEPAEYTDYSTVYFNNPARYLHLDEKENIALTESNLLNSNFIAQGIQSLDQISENRNYTEVLDQKYEIMLQMDECAFCPSFRICLGKFSFLGNKAETCKPFFSDFMDAADYFNLKEKNKERKVWQL
jgi:hypothetical protein